MSCMHKNPKGYRYCTTCGVKLYAENCDCGFPRFATDTYCGGCGKQTTGTASGNNFSNILFKYNLSDLLNIEESYYDENDQVIDQDQISELLRKNNKALR